MSHEIRHDGGTVISLSQQPHVVVGTIKIFVAEQYIDPPMQSIALIV
jgi:hypothetical protein